MCNTLNAVMGAGLAMFAVSFGMLAIAAAIFAWYQLLKYMGAKK